MSDSRIDNVVMNLVGIMIGTMALAVTVGVVWFLFAALTGRFDGCPQ